MRQRERHRHREAALALEEPARLQLTVRATPTRGRDRVSAALRCPFCRDEVAREDVVACGDRSCGALYHGECWDECRSGYGGCAVYGCGSTEAHGLGTTGFLLRWLKLMLAVALFPPRAVQTLRSPDGADLLDACQERTEASQVRLWQSRWGDALKIITILVSVIGLTALSATDFANGWGYFPHEPLGILAFFVLIPLLFLFGTFSASYVSGLVFQVLRAALAGEISALAAADRGGYLTRMLRRGKK